MAAIEANNVEIDETGGLVKITSSLQAYESFVINNDKTSIDSIKGSLDRVTIGEDVSNLKLTNNYNATVNNLEYLSKSITNGIGYNTYNGSWRIKNLTVSDGALVANYLTSRSSSGDKTNVILEGELGGVGTSGLTYGIMYGSNTDIVINGDANVNSFKYFDFKPGTKVTINKGLIGSGAFSNTTGLHDLYVINSTSKFDTSAVSSSSDLANLYLIGTDMLATSTKANLPATTLIHCEPNSTVETWCKNNGVTYVTMTEEELNELLIGKLPTFTVESKLVDMDSLEDIEFKVDLGKKPAGATGVKKVMVGSKTLIKNQDYIFNGTDTITIISDFLKTLYNGTHSVSVLFDNGTFKSGASIYVMSSTVPVIDPTKPPVALDTVKYEFYKDYPDYLIIPVSLNGATKVTQLKIGSEIVDPSEYDLDEGAIVISYNYLSTLDVGKYRVLPTFDDPAITTLNNIQLYVYENAADRAAPYLLQTRILFKGQDFTLKFDYGAGDLEASNVLALVLDDKMILQDGSIVPFTTSNVKATQKMALIDLPVASPSEAIPVIDDNKTIVVTDPDEEEPIVASPSEAMMTIQSSKVPLANITDEPFYVNNNVIYVNGEFVDSMKLKEGDHLIGAIFDNTEKTTDIKKVILSIESTNNGTNPVDPGTPTNPVDPINPVDPSTPGNGGEPKPSTGGGSSSGGTSSGGGSKTGPGVVNVTPVVPNDGGSYIVNPDNPKDVTYLDKDGNKAPNKWVGDGVNWRHTNSESKLDYNWFKDKDDTWYMLDREPGKLFGSAKTDWYYETQDGYWYYLDTKTTSMQVGWVNHNGYWYYLSPNDIAPTYTGDNYIGWTYIGNTNLRPKGAMLYNAVTPDGYKVNENGQWVQ